MTTDQTASRAASQAADERTWTLLQMSYDLGLPRETIRIYHRRASHHRMCTDPDCHKYRQGNGSPCAGLGPRAGDLPAPDFRIANQPHWLDSTYRRFKSNRKTRLRPV